METKLQTINSGAINPAMNPAEALQMALQIQEFTKSVMKINEDFGKIPGCGEKPTLLKPGAEKLLNYFGMGFTVECIEKTITKEFVIFIYRCNVYKINNPSVIIASCEGSCNSGETKYAYRNDQQLTENEVPKEYWKNRDINLIGGKGHGTKKIDGKWFITTFSEKVEIDNHFDQVNTIQKMAQKRAFVGAAISATKASHCFTQDIEDNPELYKKYDTANVQEAEVIEDKPEKPARSTTPANKDPRATPGQVDLITRKIKGNIKADANIKKMFNLKTIADILTSDVNTALEYIDKGCPEINN
jgi:hypothetical protein